MGKEYNFGDIVLYKNSSNVYDFFQLLSKKSLKNGHPVTDPENNWVKLNILRNHISDSPANVKINSINVENNKSKKRS